MAIPFERKNEFFLGSIAGILGSVFKYAFNELMQFLHVASYDNNATAITTVMPKYVGTFIYSIFGFIVAVIIGGFFGIIIAFLYSRLLTVKHYFYKAVCIGIGIWLFNFGIMSKVFKYPKGIMLSLNDMVVMLISLIIYSVVTVLALKLMGLFQETELSRV